MKIVEKVRDVLVSFYVRGQAKLYRLCKTLYTKNTMVVYRFLLNQSKQLYMSFPHAIFKAYDIRGIYPTELNEDIAHRIGQAFAEFMKAELKKLAPTLVVGRDMRISSPALAKAVIEGITQQGVNVIDVGLVSTPTFYFAVGRFRYDGGVQISASHNPAEYNGCKLVRAAGVPISGDTGIMSIRDLAEKNEFIPAAVPGTVTVRADVLKEQIDFALTQVDISKIKPLTIVVDTANGMGGPLMTALASHLPGKVIPLFFELDGRFPNHEADPLKDKNNHVLQEKVRENKADLGIAFDGDADRLFFVDNTGKTIDQAIIRGILARIFLRQYPGAAIGYDIRPGKITIDLIEEAGGIPVVTKVGHSLIKEQMRAQNMPFAGESSGHFFVRLPHGTFEAPEIMVLKFLEELSASGLAAADFVVPFYRYHHGEEINFNVEDKAAALARLREKYADHLRYDFDGLSFEWPEWWFNVRPSNTENKLRLNLEAISSVLMEEKVKEVSEMIQG